MWTRRESTRRPYSPQFDANRSFFLVGTRHKVPKQGRMELRFDCVTESVVIDAELRINQIYLRVHSGCCQTVVRSVNGGNWI